MENKNKYKKHLKHSLLLLAVLIFVGLVSHVIFSFAEINRDYDGKEKTIGAATIEATKDGERIIIEAREQDKKKEVVITSPKITVIEKHPETVIKDIPKPLISEVSPNNSVKTGDSSVTGKATKNSPVNNAGDKNTVVIENNGVVKENSATISSNIPDVKKIEYFVKTPNADNEIYLGAATKSDPASEKWNYNLDVEQRLPNGKYQLSAKVDTSKGEYRTESTDFWVEINKDESIKKDGARQEASVVEKSALDSDRDGVSNDEEKQLGSNPNNPDTDGDGFMDGDEIKNGFDPLKFSPGDKRDKVVFQTPKEQGDVKTEFKVDSAEMKKNQAGADIIKLSGKALPDRFVTIYIYSNDPIIVKIKTNANGDWSYDLDKGLENGSHEVYVAITDNTGKITAKSSPLGFIKTAQAVEVVSAAGESEKRVAQKIESPTTSSLNNSMYFSLGLIVMILIVALMLLGITVRKINKNE